jgi:hypothetical protein
MKPIFDLIMEAANIYAFLLNALIEVYVFSDFDIADENSCFGLEFSKNSCIKKYSCVEDPSVTIDGLWINLFLENDVVNYKISLTTNLAPDYRITIRCSSLGYKDGFKVFTSKQEVLDECLRLENSFVKQAPKDMVKSNGECSICNTETTLLEWPCHNSHTICEQCTNKIVEKNCVCPFCRSALPTTFSLKEEVIPLEVPHEDEYDEDY